LSTDSDQSIMRLFMLEGIIIGAIGTVLGVVVGWVLAMGLKSSGVQLSTEVYGGRIVFGGEELTTMRASRLAAVRNKDIGFVFQFHHLAAGLCIDSTRLTAGTTCSHAVHWIVLASQPNVACTVRVAGLSVCSRLRAASAGANWTVVRVADA
jgi:hypothetical protein